MPYLRCLMCSVPVFNVNCGSPESDVLLPQEARPLFSVPSNDSSLFGADTDVAIVGGESSAHCLPDLAEAEGTTRPDTIPQVTYRPQGSKRFPSATPIVLGGITIGDALHNQLNCLADFEKPAFHSGGIEVSQKMSVRIHIPEHAAYHRQVNVLRSKGRVPTRGELAANIAKDVNRFLERERQAGNPVRYNGRELTASNVLLLGVQQVSQGSLQPELGIVSTAS
ncbi:hypothetical protein V8D89_008945 [Ganoderma adspersum]